MKKNLLNLLLLSFFALSSAFAQSRKITGTVKSSDDGQPLPGVTVKITGTAIGTQTNAAGEYTLTVGGGEKSLTFSYVGYVQQIVSILKSSTINITLVSDAKFINEVVITGYTATSRDKTTGATTKVSAEKINDVPFGSFDQTLQGRVPGLSILAGSGQPGTVANVYIRGATSINGSTTPLYVIDGIPVESSVFSTLNPNDFESVDVLKDASSTSLYGSRGANGVLVITTKKGKAGQTNITYDGQAGFSNRTTAKFTMMNTSEILGLQEYLKIGAGYALSPNNPSYTTGTAANRALIDHRRDSVYNINTKWDDLFFRTGKFQSHQFSASGGSEKTRFYTSLSYYSQDGIAKRSKLDRYNLRLNLDHTAGNFKIGVQSGLGFSNSLFIESEAGVALANPYAAAYLGMPYENPFDANGNIITSSYRGIGVQPFPIYDSRIASNALARIDQTNSKNNQTKATVGFNASYQFFKGFSAKTNAGLDYRETYNESTVYPNTYAGSTSVGNSATNPSPGSYTNSNARNLQLIQTSGLEYLNNFGKHDVYATALVENVYNRYTTFGYTGYGINASELNTPAGITAGTATNGFIPVVSGGKTRAGINSLIAIARDTYDGKYTIQASVRRDGSSQVVSSNQYHNFFSVGGTWNVKKEDFLTNSSFIDVLRVRANYGTTASPFGSYSSNTVNFGYLSLYGTTAYAGTGGIAPSTPGNPDYDWEYTAATDIGVDIAVLKNRLRANIDVYVKNTHNLFVSEGLSYTSGFASLNVNAGKMRNKGIEIALEGDVVHNRDLNVTLFANFAYNDNKITDLGQVSEYASGTSIVRVGLPLGSHYIPQAAGVDPATGNYLYYNKDGSVTPVYNSTTQSVASFGTYFAPYQGGFGLNGRYKEFTVSSLFSYARKFSRFNNQSFFLVNAGNAASYNQEEIVNTIWKKPGDITTVGAYTSTRQFSSQDVQDASFVRFRNLQIGYAIPQSVIGKMKYFKGIKIFAQGENLYTWTKWTGFDPEDSNNIASFEYPAARTFTFGLNISL
ncbi:MAG: SusC/RagA family TonB-linked outer membrane protein [Bacteroidota bacterium]